MNKLPITGIGSLPHPHCDSALAHVFNYDLPFVPQLPKRSPKETMIYQTLDGIGKLQLQEDGQVEIKKINYSTLWQLDMWFDSYRCLQPFLFEARERQCPKIKIQLTGAFTLFCYSQYTTKDLNFFQTITNFLLAKIRYLCDRTKFTTLYLQIDEPALFLLQDRDYQMFQNYLKKLLLLKTEQVKIGFHCCSNGRWEQLLSHSIDFISFDWQLSIDQLLCYKNKLIHIPEFFLGIIPTTYSQLLSISKYEVQQKLYNNFSPFEYQTFINKSYITPSCGLGHCQLQDLADFFQQLNKVAHFIKDNNNLN